MASKAVLGFIQGLTGNALSGMERRRELENEERKARMLEELRSATARANFLFEQEYKRKNDPNKDLSSVDYASGKVQLRNAKGEVIGERDLTASEIEDRDFESKKNKLSLDNISSQITERKRNTDSLVASRAARGLDGSGGSEEKTPDEFAGARELVDMFKGAIPPGIDPDTVYDVALASVKTAMRSSGTEAERTKRAKEAFRFQLDHLKKSKARDTSTDPTKAPPKAEGFMVYGLPDY